ncbi:hypothetical protein [Mesorhizobium sp.]|uniref:hypothetical protein n=1 Tax=Mesorhizobium sp. TaxID=1871066 RepID=UPI0012109A5A|nr:hypothetical protein [Mesorhizobium sp.]TIS89317.1 MAG: hypothetical protein E5W89_16765 [Mesorhizobium sp.]
MVEQLYLVAVLLVDDRQLAGSGIDRSHDGSAEDINAGADIDDLGNVHSVLAQQRHHQLTQQGADRPGPRGQKTGADHSKIHRDLQLFL